MVCVHLKKEKGNGGNEKITDKDKVRKTRKRSFPECLLPGMIVLPNFIRSEGAHRES